MKKYSHLFSPIKIGETTVKNRIFMPPISTNLADKGYVTDTLVEHYAARAKGGVGLIVTEVTTVEPIYTYLPGDMSISDDSYIPGWRKLTDAVHKYGAKILPQLFHPAYMAFPIPGTPRLIAPSNVGPAYAKEAPRPVTIPELKVIIKQFGEAALRVKTAGGDGVEIHAAHAHGLLGGFLSPRPVTIPELKVIIKQFGEAALRVKTAGGDGVEIHAAHAHGLLGGFLSPLYNKRTDEYGGDINGRLKLTLEVIEEVRKKCGKDFIIDVRISGDEYCDGGLNLNDGIYIAKQLEKLTLEVIEEVRKKCGKDFIIDVRISGDEYCDGGLNLNDGIYIAKQLEKAGADMIHVSGGTTIMRGSSIPAPGTKQGSHAKLSEEIKKHTSIPIATVGRITEPWIADELIANGKADICMIGRANLCDSEFANKAEQGMDADIRPCLIYAILNLLIKLNKVWMRIYVHVLDVFAA